MIDPSKISVTAENDDVQITGGAGAVTSGGAEVSVVNASSGASVSTTSASDGSFEASVAGTEQDDYRVEVSVGGEVESTTVRATPGPDAGAAGEDDRGDDSSTPTDSGPNDAAADIYILLGTRVRTDSVLIYDTACHSRTCCNI